MNCFSWVHFTLRMTLCLWFAAGGIGLFADAPVDIKPLNINLGIYRYFATGPFADTVMTGLRWLEYSSGWGDEVYFYNTDGSVNPQFNSRGLPNYLNSGKKLRLLLWPYSEGERGGTGVGKWVVTWQGEADISLNGADFVAGESSGSSTGSLVDGRRVYLVDGNDAGGHLIVHSVNASDPVTDLKVWLPDPADPQNQSLEGSASMWHPTLLNYIQAVDFNHLRFMDWGAVNASPQQDWSDRRPPDFSIQAGVLNRRSPAPGFSGDRETGMAYEHMIDLANTTGKDLWICVPHLATDSYVTNLANLIAYGSDGTNPYTSPQANPVFPPLTNTLNAYIEYSNEIWSQGSSFPQGNWVEAQAAALGISKAQFNARRASQVWSIFQQVFGGSERIVRVGAIWTGSSAYTEDFLNELHTYGPTLSPAVYPDIISPTTYFGNGIQDWVYEQANLAAGTSNQWFHTAQTFTDGSDTKHVSIEDDDAYWSSPELAAHQDATFVEWKKRILSGSSASGGGPDTTGTGGGFAVSIPQMVTNIFGQHLPLVAYEGGPSLYTDYLDGGDSRDDGITQFIVDLNRQPEFADVYQMQLNMAWSKGLASHSLFTDVSSWGKYGQWGHLEYPDQPLTNAVKWQAVTNWAADMARLRPVDSVQGASPQFDTEATLPVGVYNQSYSAEIQFSGGDGALAATNIGYVLAPGLTVEPVAGQSNRWALSGTPLDGGNTYLYLRVQDADGDAAWKIFSAKIAGGPGNVLDVDLSGVFNAATSLPWTNTYILDSTVNWSGIDIGAAYSSSGGTATGSDGTGVSLYNATNGIRFSVSQGTSSENDSTLVSAVADNEYLTFTVSPEEDGWLNLRNAEMRLSWIREEFHAPREFAVMSSLDGFSAGNEIYLMESTPADGTEVEHVFTLPDTSAYQYLYEPVEFRVYFYGSQYNQDARLTGLVLTRADGAVDSASPDLQVPFSESFENDGSNAGTPGDLDGQRAWSVSGSGSALVQNTEVYGGSQALSISNATVSHDFEGSPAEIWIRYRSKPVFSDVPTDTIAANASAAFYVNTNAKVVAYNGTTGTVLAASSVSNDWNFFEIHCDYSSRVWNLSVNGTQVLTNFAFYAAPSAFTGLDFMEESSGGPAYIDDLSITDSQGDDTDSDGLPDSWEQQYYGDTSVAPTNMAANGINTVQEAYIAGLNPTNPASMFMISDLSPQTSVLQWTAASGRVYSVFWTSNLLSGFPVQPLASNITAGAYTDAVHGSYGEGFYKIEVEVE